MTKVIYFFKIYIYLYFILFTSVAFPYSLKRTSLSIELHGKKSLCSNLTLNWISYSSQIVHNIFFQRPSSRSSKLIFYVVRNNKKKFKKKLIIDLSESLLQQTQVIVPAIINQLARSILGQKIEKIPEWLIAACTYKIYKSWGEQNATIYMNYKALAVLFAQKCYPDFMTIIDSPIPASVYYPFLLYAEHCSIILDALRQDIKPKHLFLKKVTVALKETQSNKEFFIEVLREKRDGIQDLQAWYIRKVQSIIRSRRTILPIYILKKKIEELETIELVTSGNGYNPIVKKVKLEDSFRELKMNKESINILASKLYNQIFKILISSPIYMQPYVNKYMIAIEALRKQNIKYFINKIKDAKLSFNIGLKKYQEITKMLNDAECANINYKTSFKEFYSIINKKSKKTPIDKLLDKVEAKLSTYELR